LSKAHAKGAKALWQKGERRVRERGEVSAGEQVRQNLHSSAGVL
jgi:hypothetical protein